jgi:hypothetical protein
MILIQSSKPATYQIGDQLMVVVFQQYLKGIRFTEPKSYRIVSHELTYLFRTEPVYDEREPSYAITSKEIYNCNDLQVLITLADFLNKPQF